MSREIDILIATKVMGWVRKTNRQAFGYADDYVFEEPDEWWDELDNKWYDDKGESVGYFEDGGSCPEDREDSFSPSNNIADAWRIVESVAWGAHWAVMPCPSNGDYAIWKIRCGGTDECIARAKTAPLAICNAVLWALGVALPTERGEG